MSHGHAPPEGPRDGFDAWSVPVEPRFATPRWADDETQIRRRTGHVLDSYPEQYATQWWCGCGYREDGGYQRAMTGEEMAYAQWLAAQRDAEGGEGG